MLKAEVWPVNYQIKCLLLPLVIEPFIIHRKSRPTGTRVSRKGRFVPTCKLHPRTYPFFSWCMQWQLWQSEISQLNSAPTHGHWMLLLFLRGNEIGKCQTQQHHTRMKSLQRKQCYWKLFKASKWTANCKSHGSLKQNLLIFSSTV